MTRLRIGWILAMLAVSLASVAAAVSSLSYRRYLLHELACDAEVVVRGTISDVAKRTFDVAVEEQIAGAVVPTSITVQRFENWTCAGRWARYAKGQRVWLFLHLDAEAPNFRILGGGGEGEMPMLGDDVLVRGYRARGFEDGRWDVDGSKVDGVRIEASELAAAVRGAREALACQPSEWRVPFHRIAPRVSMDDVEAFARSSPIAKHLVDEARSSLPWRGPTTRDGVAVDWSALQFLAMSPDRRAEAVDFGGVCAWLGDVDGDGVDDIASGAPQDSKLGSRRGALTILLMNRDGSVRTKSEIREGVGGFAASLKDHANFGGAIASLGDLNGDGVPDLAVGARNWPELERARGGVWVCLLDSDGRVARSVELGSSPSMAAAGFGDGHALGSALACLGDLDGDGAVELAIGCDPRYDFAAKHGRSIFIASIEPDGEVRRARRWSSREHDFGRDPTWLGNALCRVGDLDGDGVSEVAVADTYDDDGGASRGAVWIVFLTSDGSIRHTRKISNWAGGFDGFIRDRESLGRALAGPGDVNGDGVADLLVSGSSGVWTLLLTPEGAVKAHRKLEIAGGEAQLGRSISARPSRGSADTQRVLCSASHPDRGAFIASFAFSADGALLSR